MKIKELKKAIKDLPDDMDIIIKDHYDGDLREVEKPETIILFVDEHGFFHYDDKNKKAKNCFVLTQF